FSSRRRHTRSKRDWSSDVCSSDLMSMTEEPNKASITATLVDPDSRSLTTNDFINEIEDEIEGIDESAEINIVPMSQSGMGGEPSTLTLNVSDDYADRLAESEATIIEALEDDDQIESVESSREEMVQELQV